MGDEILGYCFEPFGAGEECVFLSETRRELCLGRLVKFCEFKNAGEFLFELIVNDLDLGDSILEG